MGASSIALVVLAGCATVRGRPEPPDPAVARAAWEQRVPQDFRGSAAFAYVEEDPALPRVLIIGDSISIGYTPVVRELLAGRANVLRIPVNGGPTTRGLEQIEDWLGTGHWDVIHFNWGLHDLWRATEPDGENRVPIDQYERNLDALVQRLKRTKAKLIWASTTPVPEGARHRVAGDAARYNVAAAAVMKEQHVPTDDLYGAVVGDLGAYQRPADVHFTENGSAFLGERVAAEISKALGRRRRR
ncbi:MAG: SGNH/GDSL hydrolase family protein [Candidatus Hydrogenedentes bacterium]|nr:SGNH/GDSL hydrolase family protein [Candidatus Hydrogenedentota bacterium]